MKNIIEYIKDKSYYLLGGIVIVIILLIIINACSNSSGGYDKIEQKMVNAAKSYYASHKKNLPKEENGTVKVTISTLIESELLKEVKDPNNKDQDCSGYVEVTKVGKEYSYTPFLVCKGNYEPKYLTDIVKSSKQDEYGNGVYEMGGEYVYRGDDVKNYVSFNNQLWRIVKIDKENNIELVYNIKDNSLKSAWDSRYNSEIDRDYGITTDYLQSDIRKTLDKFDDEKLNEDAKARLVKKDICVGKKALEAAESATDECSITQNEKVGLLVISDYKNASLDENCTRYDNRSCINRNYLSNSEINSWLLTTVSDNTYEAYYIDEEIKVTKANRVRNIYPAVYLNKNTIVVSGKGTVDKPYKIK